MLKGWAKQGSPEPAKLEALMNDSINKRILGIQFVAAYWTTGNVDVALGYLPYGLHVGVLSLIELH
jgi:hypothetical protein